MKITYSINIVNNVTVIEEVTNGKVIGLLYDFQGHREHCIIKISDPYL